VCILVWAAALAGCQAGGGSRDELLRYVSLGDSFPAGEGLPGATGRCGRSTSAYPSLLARSANLLPSLHACTGATTEDVLERERHPGEGRQVDWLGPDTDVVTITVGGNDAGFVRVIGACLTRGEPCSRLDDEVDAQVAGLQDRLDAVNREIRRRLPDARILVVGYPHVVADPGQVDVEACPELGGSSGNSLVTRGEAAWLREQGEALAVVMRESAEAVGARYVDAARAFAGHEVCTTAPWMTGVVVGNIGASFHPNAAGHEALARLVAEALEAS
jgi:lysophospholipase L1-like esterase